MNSRTKSILLPGTVAVAFVALWHILVRLSGSDIFPAPISITRRPFSDPKISRASSTAA